MDGYEKGFKVKLEKIPGVSIKVDFNKDSKVFREVFNGVKNNLNFFSACITRVTTSLRNTHELILNLEEFYREKMNSSHYESELEVFQIIINSELFKILDTQKSTKFKGIPLLDKESEKYIDTQELLIDVCSTEKFKVDFADFNLDPDSDTVSEVGINLGAKNKLINLTLLNDKEALKSGKEIFKSSFFNDFEFYRFNIERMLDRALSITATLESKLALLAVIEKSFTDQKESKKKTEKINFVSLNKHLEEDSKRIAQFV